LSLTFKGEIRGLQPSFLVLFWWWWCR